jgi:ubiquinone/menaquinone biosynthesis C-methylase UbiE
MPRDIDGLTSSTLKHLRDRWWDDAFTGFLREMLQPRAGTRILDVGCGTGTGELSLGRLRLSQVQFFAIDLLPERARETRLAARAHNVQVACAAADACRLPFVDHAFDATFCVAVLQHIQAIGEAVAELARVTRPDGRVLVVEPDNRARYSYSSLESGTRTFEMAGHFFAALAAARGDATDPAVGPKMPGVFAQHGIEPLAVSLFPVSVSRLGAPPPSVWTGRREAIESLIARAPDESIKRLGSDYLKQVRRYGEEADAAGPSFVEIQNTMLFATIGQRVAA